MNRGPGSRAGNSECSCAAKESNWSMSSLFALFRNGYQREDKVVDILCTKSYLD